MTYKVKLITEFKLVTVYEAESYLDAVKMNSEWLAENYGDLEDYMTQQNGDIK